MSTVPSIWFHACVVVFGRHVSVWLSSLQASSGGIHPVLKAGLISGSLSLTGDVVAQLLGGLLSNEQQTVYDLERAARMGSFGLFFYGPYQHYWYAALERAFTAKSVQNFATKVFLNQTVLAPVVISGIFAWNLALQKKISEWPEKMKKDFKNTILTGWKFWIPASSINFVMVPLQHQVLYMSCCGVVWTAFLSYSSSIQRGKLA